MKGREDRKGQERLRKGRREKREEAKIRDVYSNGHK